jgi:hypothetical protein
MTEEKKPGEEPQSESWKHDQELSFKRVVPQLHILKEALEKAITQEKAKLSQMVGARDSIRRK